MLIFTSSGLQIQTSGAEEVSHGYFLYVNLFVEKELSLLAKVFRILGSKVLHGASFGALQVDVGVAQQILLQ